ncbi:GFA family protein [Caulobacter sp.]|uniref:GFA family protein n=1 Tax=Caulobacter sp. TaxID=78 RepID=UPI0025C2B4FE|nr:GFA family protein [Caulobacter sp.]
MRFKTRGEPKRGGLCHCMTCRKAHASAFNPFVVFEPAAVEISGLTAGWESSPGYVRAFCPVCGSRVVAVNDHGEGGREIELSLGSFDEAGWFRPDYESWTVRREPWLQPLCAPQFARERTR